MRISLFFGKKKKKTETTSENRQITDASKKGLEFSMRLGLDQNKVDTLTMNRMLQHRPRCTFIVLSKNVKRVFNIHTRETEENGQNMDNYDHPIPVVHKSDQMDTRSS